MTCIPWLLTVLWYWETLRGKSVMPRPFSSSKKPYCNNSIGMGQEQRKYQQQELVLSRLRLNGMRTLSCCSHNCAVSCADPTSPAWLVHLSSCRLTAAFPWKRPCTFMPWQSTDCANLCSFLFLLDTQQVVLCKGVHLDSCSVKDRVCPFSFQLGELFQ